MRLADTAPLRHSIERLVPERPFAIQFWDGTSVRPTRDGGPVFSVRSPRALFHLLRAPGQLGLGRAYVSGELEVDDLDALNRVIYQWTPPEFTRRTRLRLLLAAARAAGTKLSLTQSAAELRPRGRLHSRARDAQAVRHHYDVSNEFFALFLDRSMTYSCAFFSLDGTSLEAAQAVKLELSCKKLRLQPGQRVLDVGCGWGGFAIHAATHHGVNVIEHVEEFGQDYAETLKHWAERLDRQRQEAVRLGGAERVRVWRLYLRGTGARSRLAGTRSTR